VRRHLEQPVADQPLQELEEEQRPVVGLEQGQRPVADQPLQEPELEQRPVAEPSRAGLRTCAGPSGAMCALMCGAPFGAWTYELEASEIPS